MLATPGLLRRRSYRLNSRAFPAALPCPWGGPWHTFPLDKVALPSSSAKGVPLKALFPSQSGAGSRLSRGAGVGAQCGVAEAGSEQHRRHSWGLPLQAPWAGTGHPSVRLSPRTHPPAPPSAWGKAQQPTDASERKSLRGGWRRPHSLSLEGCFAPAKSPYLFYIHSLDLKPRENMLGVMASSPPALSAFSPRYRGAKALGLQELLRKASWKLSNPGSSGWTTVLPRTRKAAQGQVRVVFLLVGGDSVCPPGRRWEEASC